MKYLIPLLLLLFGTIKTFGSSDDNSYNNEYVILNNHIIILTCTNTQSNVYSITLSDIDSPSDTSNFQMPAGLKLIPFEYQFIKSVAKLYPADSALVKGQNNMMLYASKCYNDLQDRFSNLFTGGIPSGTIDVRQLILLQDKFYDTYSFNCMDCNKKYDEGLDDEFLLFLNLYFELRSPKEVQCKPFDKETYKTKVARENAIVALTEAKGFGANRANRNITFKSTLDKGKNPSAADAMMDSINHVIDSLKNEMTKADTFTRKNGIRVKSVPLFDSITDMVHEIRFKHQMDNDFEARSILLSQFPLSGIRTSKLKVNPILESIQQKIQILDDSLDRTNRRVIKVRSDLSAQLDVKKKLNELKLSKKIQASSVDTALNVQIERYKSELQRDSNLYLSTNEELSRQKQNLKSIKETIAVLEASEKNLADRRSNNLKLAFFDKVDALLKRDVSGISDSIIQFKKRDSVHPDVAIRHLVDSLTSIKASVASIVPDWKSHDSTISYKLTHFDSMMHFLNQINYKDWRAIDSAFTKSFNTVISDSNSNTLENDVKHSKIADQVNVFHRNISVLEENIEKLLGRIREKSYCAPYFNLSQFEQLYYDTRKPQFAGGQHATLKNLFVIYKDEKLLLESLIQLDTSLENNCHSLCLLQYRLDSLKTIAELDAEKKSTFGDGLDSVKLTMEMDTMYAHNYRNVLNASASNSVLKLFAIPKGMGNGSDSKYVVPAKRVATMDTTLCPFVYRFLNTIDSAYALMLGGQNNTSSYRKQIARFTLDLPILAEIVDHKSKDILTGKYLDDYLETSDGDAIYNVISDLRDSCIKRLTSANDITRETGNLGKTDSAIAAISDTMKKQQTHLLNSFPVRNLFQYDSVQLEFAAGTLKNLSITGKYNGNVVRLFNHFPIPFSAVKDLEGFGQITLYDPDNKKYTVPLNGVLSYLPNFVGKSEDYSPGDTVVSIYPNVYNRVLLKENIHEILEAKIYSDLMGTIAGNPNGLVQIELSHQFNLLAKYNKYWHSRFYCPIKYNQLSSSAYVGFLNFYTPSISWTKIEQNNRTLPVQRTDSLVYLDGRSQYKHRDPTLLPGESFKSYVSTLQAMRYAYLTIKPINFNFFNVHFPAIKSDFRIDGGVTWYITALGDSTAQKQDSLYYIKNQTDNVNSTAFNSEVIWEYWPHPSINFTFSTNFIYYKIWDRRFLQAGDAVKFQDYLDYRHREYNWMINPTFNVSVYPAPKKFNGDFYFRLAYTALLQDLKQNYIQTQLGFSFTIMK